MRMVGTVWTGSLFLQLNGTDGDQAKFDFHCRACGGWLIHVDDDDPYEQATCTACGEYFGNMPGIRDEMRRQMIAAGLKPLG